MAEQFISNRPSAGAGEDLWGQAWKHAVECFENGFRGGNEVLFADVVNAIEEDTAEYHIIAAQTIASAIRERSAVANLVKLLCICHRSPHESVRANSVLLAKRLQNLSPELDERTRYAVEECIATLKRDNNAGVKTNIDVLFPATPK